MSAAKVEIRYDRATQEWFSRHLAAETTVCRCEECGLFYKPGLGHRCPKESGRKAREDKKNGKAENQSICSEQESV